MSRDIFGRYHRIGHENDIPEQSVPEAPRQEVDDDCRIRPELADHISTPTEKPPVGDELSTEDEPPIEDAELLERIRLLICRSLRISINIEPTAASRLPGWRNCFWRKPWSKRRSRLSR